MSQIEKKGVAHKLIIKNKNPGTISTGANTEVLLDGNKLGGVRFIKLEFKAKSVTKVLIELLADVEIETETELAKTQKELYHYEPGKDRLMARYELGSYEPKAVDVIKEACAKCKCKK